MSLSQTTKYAIFALLFFVVSFTVSGFTYYHVSSEGEKLEEQMELVGKNHLMQDRYNSLSEILNESKADNQQLESHLLTEGKVINFLSEIETLARDMGLVFSTDALEVGPLSNPQFQAVNLNLRADGDQATLLEFMNILETLPYFGRINELSLNAQSGGTWTAKVKLMVGMHNHDK